MDTITRARRVLLPLYQSTARQLHELKYLFFELTQDCNLRCLHCGSDCQRQSSVPPLPADDILRVLREIKGRYDSTGISVVLTGGEPLCYPGLFQLGARISGLQFPWGMVTNGFAWTPERIAEARDAGMSAITVSLDGLEEDHDWFRGRDESFRRALTTISLLTANRFWQAMDVITCVNKRNLHSLLSVHRRLLDLGVPSWRLFTISPIGRAPQVPELFLSADEYQRMLATIRELKTVTAMNVELSESGYLGPRHELSVRGQYYFCRAGINVAGIMVNGDILACPNIDRRFRQGNIHQDSFIDVWENRYREFRDRSWMRVGQCRSCSQWRYCQGNSFHLWDFDKGQTKLCHCQQYRLWSVP